MTQTGSQEETTLKMLPLSAITERLRVRRLHVAGLLRIQESIQRFGFLENFPLVVTPLEKGTYQLIEGNHRYEAVRALGLTAVPCVVKTNLSKHDLYTLVWQSNSAAETVVPSTLVTYAEFIWERSKGGDTQAEIAAMLGWGRSAVSNYAALEKIDASAWAMIATTCETAVAKEDEGAVAPVATTVAFTERLLRDILDLTPEQQIELVTALAENKDFSKGKFKTLTENYRARNEMYDYASQQLGDLVYRARVYYLVWYVGAGVGTRPARAREWLCVHF